MHSAEASLPGDNPRELDYFIEWRPYLWRRPVHQALKYLGDLHGRRVLELGGRSGRMTSLFALRGAQVTMVERAPLEAAKAEVDKWGLADRVRMIRTQGGLEDLAGETFDVIFTKSVLWSVEHLGGLLDIFQTLLAPGGQVAFVENHRGSPALFWVRRNILHRGRFDYENRYFGITPSQIPLFRERFDDLQVRRHRYFVYTICGQKSASPKVAQTQQPLVSTR